MSDNSGSSGGWPGDGVPQQPGQGPYAANQPVSGQPNQPGYQPGYQPPAGQGHHGGPPKKKKTGLIVGAVVAAIVLIAGLGIGGWLIFGGEDDSDNTSNQKTEETQDPSEEPSDEESEDTTAAPAEGTIAGTNYSYEVPGDEWQDAKDLFAQASPPVVVDTAIIWGDSLDTAEANVLFEASQVGDTTLEALEEQWKTNLQAGNTPAPTDLPRTEIDGEEALAVERDFVNAAGSKVYQTVYLVLHDGYAYSIAFTRQSEGDTIEDAETAFDRVKGSFSWDS